MPETAGAKPRSETEFYSRPIVLAELKPAALNHFRLEDGVEVVVIARGAELSILRDICPHMGAPLSEGKYRPQDGELECPWHGYCYSGKDGAFLRNPNDAVFAKLKGYWSSYKPEKTPKYRLQQLAYEIKDGKAYVRRPAAS